MSRSKYGWIALLGVVAGAGGACGGDTGMEPDELECGDLDPAYLADGGVGRDGIPALTDPLFVPLDDEAQTTYLSEESRVIGVLVDGEWRGIPHNVMYRHEIVNLNLDEERVAVTYCPLTGSALTFDREQVDGAAFGVSGLLYQANLIMYDRNSEDSLWPQMAGVAACGAREGRVLVRRPVVETTWAGWKELFPGSVVLGIDPSLVFTYGVNPYGIGYEHPDNPDFIGFPLPRDDTRRRPKERVLGLPAAEGRPPVAFPFLAMEEEGDFWTAAFDHAGEPAVVFWDADRQTALAMRPVAGGQALTFQAGDDGFVDGDTGARWNVAGRATGGSLEGEQLEIIAEAYVAFWLPWAAFHPGTNLFIE